MVAGLTATTATAQDNTLRSDQAVARSCFEKQLTKRDRGVALHSVTSTVDGMVQARLRPHGTGSGDWDVAVFDQATGAVGRPMSATSAPARQGLPRKAGSRP